MNQDEEAIRIQIEKDRAQIANWTETEKRLKKEIAFAQYQVSRFSKSGDKERLTIAKYILGKLQCVEGTHPEGAKYSKEFEEYYAQILKNAQ